jgi:uncharacterized membrane protein
MREVLEALGIALAVAVCVVGVALLFALGVAAYVGVLLALVPLTPLLLVALWFEYGRQERAARAQKEKKLCDE